MKIILTIIIGVFLLLSVSALYGGETQEFTFEFEPVICEVSDNLSYNINQKDVSVDIPTNFVGNLTIVISCFGGEEEEQKIVYRGGGGGSRTRYVYENITEYKDKIVEKLVEKEVPIEVEVKGDTEFIETNTLNKIVLAILCSILAILIWALAKYIISNENQNTNIKEEEKYE